jgi:polysaccharide biosynthesis/export protein
MASPSTVLRSMLLLSFLGGCAAPAHLPSPEKASRLPASPETTAVASPPLSGSPAARSANTQETADLERLAQLWQKRTQEGAISDYPIGPGDVLEITVPAIEELSNRTVRVSGEGTLSLPFVGLVQASGLTEEGLKEEIRRRLADYMYKPQLTLFVREYRSRQVAVIGAVEKPGLYSLASGADTILAVISLAGGMKEDAASRIYFIPAEPGANGTTTELSASLPVQLASTESSSLLLKSANPIAIDLKRLTKGGDQIYLTLPVRPGDVLLVPGGGEVLVGGWVEKPASYKITPGLTVVGAVTAAGGPHFAADTNSVKVMRAGKDGEQVFFVADLEKIRLGESPDIPVQEGDVIEVSSSTSKLVPYGFYRFLSAVLHVGASASLY